MTYRANAFRQGVMGLSRSGSFRADLSQFNNDQSRRPFICRRSYRYRFDLLDFDFTFLEQGPGVKTRVDPLVVQRPYEVDVPPGIDVVGVAENVGEIAQVGFQILGFLIQ